MKILIVEDEQDLRETIRTSLLKEKFVVETAADYFSALDKINDYDYDCILLDIMLPGGSGLDLLRELKHLRRTDSVLIISAKDSLDDKVDGLELGADDYLTKPFSVDELLARLRVTQRRLNLQASGEVSSSVFVNGPLKIDFAAGCVWLNDEELHLTPIEYKLLCVLAHNVGKVLTHTAITQKVWGKLARKRHCIPARLHGIFAQKSWNQAHIRCIWFRPMWGSATGCCVLKRMIRQKNSPQADSDKTKTGCVHPDAPCQKPQTIAICTTGSSPVLGIRKTVFEK